MQVDEIASYLAMTNGVIYGLEFKFLTYEPICPQNF
jgi:hypothetical protein